MTRGLKCFLDIVWSSEMAGQELRMIWKCKKLCDGCLLATGSYYKKGGSWVCCYSECRNVECLKKRYSGIGIFSINRLRQSGIGIVATG
jgi:hypothetical protein